MTDSMHIDEIVNIMFTNGYLKREYDNSEETPANVLSLRAAIESTYEHYSNQNPEKTYSDFKIYLFSKFIKKNNIEKIFKITKDAKFKEHLIFSMNEYQ